MEMQLKFIAFMSSLSYSFASAQVSAPAAASAAPAGISPSAAAAPAAESAVVAMPPVSLYEQFINRFAFCDSKNRVLDHMLSTRILMQGIDSERIIQGANRAGPIAIRRFMELNSDLSEDEKRSLKFLIFAYNRKEDLMSPPTGDLRLNLLKAFSKNTEEQTWFGTILSNIERKEAFPLPNILTYQVYWYLEQYCLLYNMIENGKIHIDEKDIELSNCLKKIDIPEAKSNYAFFLEDKKIHVTWEGVHVKDNDQTRYADCGMLLKKAGTPEAKCNYAILLREGKIHITWDNHNVEDNDEARYADCGKLYKEAGTPIAKVNYAILLVRRKIDRTWEGDVTNNDQARYGECARLYKQAKTPLAKFNYMSLILKNNIRIGFNDENFETDNDAFMYVLSYVTTEFKKDEEKHRDFKAYLECLAQTKLINDDPERFNTAYAIYHKELMSGNRYIRLEDFSQFFSSGTDTDEKTEVSGELTSVEHEEKASVSSQNQNKKLKTRKECRAESAVAAQAKHTQSVESCDDDSDEQNKEEQDKEERDTKLKAWKNYCALTIEQRKSHFENMASQSLSRSDKSYDFHHYRVVNLDGSDYASEDDKIKQLIMDIKSRVNSGQVHTVGRAKDGKTKISRKTTKKDRLVYAFDHEKEQIVVYGDEGHYGD